MPGVERDAVISRAGSECGVRRTVAGTIAARAFAERYETRWRSASVTRRARPALPLRPVDDAPATQGLAIRLLGPLEVDVDGARLVVDTRKALAILALLAAERRPFARDELAALLWPESDDESARGALRRTLSVLRSALGDRWLRVDRAMVELDPGGLDGDLDLVTEAASSGDVRLIGRAATLARGPFLAGFTLRDSPGFDDWRATRAAAVDRTVGAVLDRLVALTEAAGDVQAAVSAAMRRVMSLLVVRGEV